MSKKPSVGDKSRYIGIEIEAFGKNVDAVFKKHEVRSVATIVGDSSIRVPGGFPSEYVGFELQVLSKQTQLVSVLRAVDDFLKRVKASVNDSCGLHVHLDMRQDDWRKCYKRLWNKQDEMFSMVHETRRNNYYCEKVYETQMESICSYNKVDYGEVQKVLRNMGVSEYTIDDIMDMVRDECEQDIETDHYDAISANPILEGEHQTLEVRIHHGTVDVKEIQEWCRYLIEVAYKNQRTEWVKNYVQKRIKKFA